MQFLRQTLFVLILFHLGGCASTLQTPELLSQPPDGLDNTHFISNVPFFPQELYQCGPAALATLLNFKGINSNPESLIPLVYIPDKQGSYQLELLAASRSLGMLSYIIDEDMAALLTEVNAGNPVLVLQNQGIGIFPQWHFAVVKGFDLDNEKIILNSGTIEDYQLAMLTFERTWRRADYWAFTASLPGEVPATANANQYFLTLNDFRQINTNPADLNRAFQAGIRRWPDYQNLSMAYGNFLYEEQQLQNAAEVFRALIAQDQQYAPAYNNLAHILFELEAYQEAYSMAQMALQIGGQQNPAYQNTYRMIEDKLNNN